MPQCLWCDAINEEHPNFKNKPTPENTSKPEATGGPVPQSNTIAEEKDDHPAGLFMWSAMFLGCLFFGYVFIAIFETIFHRKALIENKSALKFFSTTLVVNMAIIFIVSPVTNVFVHVISKHPTTANSGAPSLFNFALSFVFAIIQGFITAKILAKFTPDYNKKEYRKTELIGIITGLALFVVCTIAYAAYLTYKN